MNHKITLAARASPLALIQAREAAGLLPNWEIAFLPLLSAGDRDKRTSLLDEAPADFFTRELDEAVLNGEADAAVHSAKDLPYPLPPGLALAALTPPLDASEALVSRGRLRLNELPGGANVGVSSARRQGEILALRPDLAAKSIRGTIEERIELVKEGDYDAAVVAVCALKRLGLEREIAEILPFPAHPLQGMLAVTVRADRVDLLALFQPHDFRRIFGTVVIAGAGPGDPGLLTRKAARACAEAEVVVYDDLIHPDVIRSIRAEKIYAGKRRGRQTLGQEEINELLYRHARAGRNILRLKGGDPVFFARTGEEVDYLKARHIPTTIIPGVSSAAAGAAAAGFPLTRRGRARSVAFASAQGAGEEEINVPRAETLVYFMAASRLSALSGALLASGRAPDTPVCLVRAAGYPDELIRNTTVAQMAGLTVPSPLSVIIGAAAEEAGKRGCLLYTGLSLPPFLKTAGERIVHYPLIRIKKLAYRPPRPLSSYEALIFSSKTAVRLFSELNGAVGLPVYAVGPATAAALRRRLKTDIIFPAEAHSKALAALLRASGVGRTLYPCSAHSQNPVHLLPGVERLDLYETLPRSQTARDLSSVSSVHFTSPSTVASFLALYGAIPGHLLCRAQGPVTARALERAGVPAEHILHV